MENTAITGNKKVIGRTGVVLPEEVKLQERINVLQQDIGSMKFMK